MPLAYWIAPESQLVFVCGHDTVTEREALALRYSLYTHPQFDPSYRELIDQRRVTAMKMSEEGLKRLATLNPYRAETRRAVVAPDEMVYQMARRYQQSRPRNRDTIEVFQSWLAALDWLSLTEGDLPGGKPQWTSEADLAPESGEQESRT